MEQFELEGNRLTIQFDLLDDKEELVENCLNLLDSKENEIEIFFSDRVFSLNSNHIGILLMTHINAKRKGKELILYCNERLERLFRIIGGSNLNIISRPNIIT